MVGNALSGFLIIVSDREYLPQEKKRNICFIMRFGETKYRKCIYGACILILLFMFLRYRLHIQSLGSVKFPKPTSIPQPPEIEWCSGKLSYLAPDQRTHGVTGLISFPGSGNTWLRYLLQQATGIHTGSWYSDKKLMYHGFPAESISNSSVLVVKCHSREQKSFYRFQRIILLVRDPEQCILAEFNRKRTDSHVGVADEQRFQDSSDWNKFTKVYLKRWANTNLMWAKQFPGAVKIVYYADLVADVEGTLRDILEFLQYPVDEDLMACTLNRKMGVHKRKKWRKAFDPFTKEMHRNFTKTMRIVYREIGLEMEFNKSV